MSHVPPPNIITKEDNAGISGVYQMRVSDEPGSAKPGWTHEVKEL